jgi:hypothetical protein
MLDKFVTAVTDWPVLLQAVIGSAIFWLVLLVGQKLAVRISAKYSVSSKKRRKDFLIEQRLKYFYKTTTDNTIRSVVVSALTYRAFRNSLRAAIWLILGLLGGSLISVLAVIGFLGALYYLFAAMNTLTAVPDDADASEKFKEITKELEELDGA